MQETMRATSAGRARRRPRTFGADRVCAHADCETKLSRYNSATHCFSHAPAKFRRLRGEFTSEYLTRQS